jgi:hypothetical protein
MSSLQDVLGMMPLCITPTSKTTVTDDPMAGMTPEQITEYMSNVGGGMCGYPEWVTDSINSSYRCFPSRKSVLNRVYFKIPSNYLYSLQVRSAVGIALNLSLISFGVFTASYAILYIIQGILQKQVDDTVKDGMGSLNLAGASPSSRVTSSGSSFDFKPPSSSASGSTNRKERRLRDKIKKEDM